MAKAISAIVATLSALLAIALAGLTLKRARLPYNSEGRYFDTRDSVVYQQSAVETYALLAAGLAVIALGAAIWAFRAWRR